MAKNADRSGPEKRTEDNRDEPFYESLPATFGTFADNFQAEEDLAADEEERLLTGEQTEAPRADSRLTAIITILLVAFVAIVLGILFLRGLDTIKSTVPSSQSDSSGSLEL